MSGLSQTENFWAKVCFEPRFKPQGRYQLYRELVSDRMLQVLQNVCPVANEILTEAEWQKILGEYLKKSPPQSEILRDLPYEFSAWLKSHRHGLSKKFPYLGELVEYEAMEVKVNFLPDDAEKTPRGKLRLNPAHFLGHYRWPVHFLSADFHDIKKIPRGAYHLLLWRDSADNVNFMEVNALVASLIRELETGPKKLVELLKTIAAQNGIPAGEEFISEGKALMADLEEKEILKAS